MDKQFWIDMLPFFGMIATLCLGIALGYIWGKRKGTIKLDGQLSVYGPVKIDKTMEMAKGASIVGHRSLN